LQFYVAVCPVLLRAPEMELNAREIYLKIASGASEIYVWDGRIFLAKPGHNSLLFKRKCT